MDPPRTLILPCGMPSRACAPVFRHQCGRRAVYHRASAGRAWFCVISELGVFSVGVLRFGRGGPVLSAFCHCPCPTPSAISTALSPFFSNLCKMQKC